MKEKKRFFREQHLPGVMHSKRAGLLLALAWGQERSCQGRGRGMELQGELITYLG